MNRQIFRIALPSIVSNITVPLLSLADTTIVGHLGAAAYIGAIALGGMVFNLIYWLFGFLRMGTGGLTAQAYGAGNRTEAQNVLLRSLLLALGVSLGLWLLQVPLLHIVFHFVEATPEVKLLASCYFNILIWGAPAMLGLYSFSGWFLGMQNARYPMLIAIVQNMVNIAVSLSLVFVCHMKVEGVAGGTLVAQYAGLLMALLLWTIRYKPFRQKVSWCNVWHKEAWRKFFSVNRDIFLRTLCLICVSTYFTACGASQGDLVLAANSLLMQFFIFFSYVMDGFAYSGEALGGRFYGAHENQHFGLLARRLFLCGSAVAAAFTMAYALAASGILHLLTNNPSVVSTALRYVPFAIGIPFVSMAAFLFDGLFIGTTSTREMLISMFAAMLVFFIILFTWKGGNTALWSAFLAYLGSRGLIQLLLFPKVMRKIRA